MVDLPMRHQRTFPTPVFLLIFILLIAGCANLQAIRQFAQSSTQAETYKAIADDYAKIPEREKYYSLTKYHAGYDQQNKVRSEQLKALLDIQKVIAEYMKALGELAADELISYDKSIDSLTEGLKATKALDEGELQAFGAITKLLARAMVDGYRQKKLNQVITEANQPLQTLLAAQVNFVELYNKSLKEEKKSVDSYYGDAINKAAKDKVEKSKDMDQASKEKKMKILQSHYEDIIIDEIKDPFHQGILILVRDNMQERFEVISKKQESARHYIKVLKTIGEGHQKLYDERYKLKSPQLLAAIKGYAKYIADLVNAVKALK